MLKVKSQGATDNFRTVLRFTMPASIPPGCTIESATLRLYSPSGVGGRTIQALRLNGTWTENGVTWGNQPATTGTAATTTTSSGAAWRQWNVTGEVLAAYTAGAHHGFLIRDAAEGGSGAEQQFTTRNGSSNRRPQLVITYTTANEGQQATLSSTSLSDQLRDRATGERWREQESALVVERPYRVLLPFIGR